MSFVVCLGFFFAVVLAELCFSLSLDYHADPSIKLFVCLLGPVGGGADR